MPIAPGTRLGVYEVLSPLGAGGMGEVYRARDTKLRRDVALKVLPSLFAADPDRRARFAREAHVLATLNHPNIAAIYGLEEGGDTTALVLELVDGPTLADRIGAGALPMDEALRIAHQIAEALDAAHEKGIVHRDLKPANIKIGDDGRVKVLDFGLAKALTDDTSTDASLSPTMTAMASRLGIIVGTAAYMSPEQAKGKAVDKRTDIWAFGCVLFEMLTGQRAFPGEDIADFIAAIMTKEPDWTLLPAHTPPRVVELLQHCVKKDTRERLRDIGDATRWMTVTGREPASAPSHGDVAHVRASRIVAAAIAFVVGGAVAATGMWWLSGRQASLGVGAVTRLSIPLPRDAPLQLQSWPGLGLAIAPDGARVAYVAPLQGNTLRLRRLDDRTVTIVGGTEGAAQPFFSPDGRWLAFFTLDGHLKKVSVDGGSPDILLNDLSGSGWSSGSWTDGDEIVFDTWNAGLRVIPATGGTPRELTKPTAERHGSPIVLPDGRTVLFTVTTGDSVRIDAIGLDGNGRRTVLPNASRPTYLPSGHLLFVRDGAMRMVVFDASRAAPSGTVSSAPIDVVMDNPNLSAPRPQLDVSRNGVLVFALPEDVRRSNESTLTWVDRAGREIESFTLPFELPFFSLSPDGERLAVAGRSDGVARNGVFDLKRKAYTELFRFHEDFFGVPMWDPGGRSLLFPRRTAAEAELWLQPADGRTEPARLFALPATYAEPGGFSPDGRFVVFGVGDSQGASDLAMLDLSDRNKPEGRPWFPRPISGEFLPQFSPDGRWVSYTSDESGRPEIYVRRFPAGTDKTRVSVDGGQYAGWISNGREIVYASIESAEPAKLLSVRLTTEPELKLEAPQVLFQRRFVPGDGTGTTWVASKDGQRFLLLRGDSVMARSHELMVVQNWPPRAANPASK